jgi:nucleoside-triphosphatase THEP1
MKIAYTTTTGQGDTDRLLIRLASRLDGAGARLCGTVQTNHDAPDRHGCDMDVTVLPSGPIIRISQSLGRHARGCRLDPDALEQAVTLSEAVLDGGADILIVNKFGKHEAAGGGYRGLIAKALERDVPVLVGLSRLNAEAFHEFTGGLAEAVQPDLPELLDWCRQAGVPASMEDAAAHEGSPA